MGDPNSWEIDPDEYYDAARRCHHLAEMIAARVQETYGFLTRACAGMAGNTVQCVSWAATYDATAETLIAVTALLSDALTRYGDVLAGMGYNWHISNKSQPPSRPTESELIDSRYELPAVSSGNNGPGLESTIPGVVDQVEDVPNGDTYKTQLAISPVWSEFTADPAINESETRIKEISNYFDGKSPNGADIVERMETMRVAAATVAAISPAFKTTANDFHSALVELRAALKSNLEMAEAPVMVEIKKTRIVVRKTADGSTASVAEIAATIQGTVSSSRFIQVADLPFGGKAIELIQQLSAHIAPLRDIAQLRLELMDDGSGSEGDGKPTPGKTPEEKARIVLDIVTDNNGNLIGREDASGVMIVSREDLDAARAALHERLGPPEVKQTPKGTIEVWVISTDPKSNVTYRSFSDSGGATIDFNSVPGVPIKRWHISQ